MTLMLIIKYINTIFAYQLCLYNNGIITYTGNQIINEQTLVKHKYKLILNKTVVTYYGISIFTRYLTA